MIFNTNNPAFVWLHISVLLIVSVISCRQHNEEISSEMGNFQEFQIEDFILCGVWKLIDGHILTTDSATLITKYDFGMLAKKINTNKTTKNWNTYGVNYKNKYFYADTTSLMLYALGVPSDSGVRIVGMIEIPPSTNRLDSIWIPWLIPYLNKTYSATETSNSEIHKRRIVYDLFGFRGDSLMIVSTLGL